jgi:hypothetical protein
MNNPVATVVYFLCLIASAGCAWLLVRSYIRTKAALLLWTAICFILFGVNNLLLVVDLVFLPDSIDLRVPRVLSNVAALATLLYGFIWEVD